MRFLSLVLTWLIGGPVVHFLTAQVPSSSFSSSTILRLEDVLQASRQEIEQQLGLRRQLSTQYDSMLVDVSYLKQRKDLGFFENIRLKNLLKESEDISRQLVLMDQRVTARKKEHDERVDQLCRLMDIEIKQVLQQLEDSDARQGRGALESTLQAMMTEKLEFQSSGLESWSVKPHMVKVSRQDDAETIYQKADFLRDQEDKLAAYSAELQSKIEKISSDAEIRDQAIQFLDDVHFFNRTREIQVAHKDGKDRNENLGGETGTSDHTARDGDEITHSFQPSLNGFDASVFVNGSTLSLTDLKMSPDDDLRVIVRKLQTEKAMADNQVMKYRRLADELYELAKYKMRLQK